MFVKRGDVKIIKVIEADEVTISNKKIRKAIDKQKKIAKTKVLIK